MAFKNFIATIRAIRPIRFGIVVFFVILLITQYTAYVSYRLQKDTGEEETRIELERVKDNIQTFLNHALSATHVLAFWAAHTQDSSEFDTIAATIMESNPCIDVLQMTDKGVINKVYPYEGNEVVIGYDILADPKINLEAGRAIEKGDLYFAGPFDLRQGGNAVVGRLPMFNKEEFLGFSVVIIYWQHLLDAVGIAQNNNKEYAYQLSKIDPNTQKEVFFLPDSEKFKKELAISANVPVGGWKLYVAPAIAPRALFNGILYALLGLLLSVSGGFLAWYMASQPSKLRLMVFEKTNQIFTEQKISESIINSLPGIFYLYDRNGKLWRWNKNFEQVTGHTPEEIEVQPRYSYFAEEQREMMTQKIANVYEKGEDSIAAYFVTKTGQKIPYYLTGRKMVLNGQDYMIGVGLDISESVKNEEELRRRNAEILELTKNLEKIREEERTRIAREIHDLLGQQLTALKMDLAWVQKKYAPDEGTVNQKIANMIGLIDETIQTVRRISSELRPSMLDDLGLIAALEWQGKDFANRSGLQFMMVNELPEFNPDPMLATQVFRIFQESLTNIARHAHATVLKVVIYSENDTVCMEISDDGKGFNVAGTMTQDTLGVLGMKERATLINATLTIQSEPGRGTTVSLRIPLTKSKEL